MTEDLEAQAQLLGRVLSDLAQNGFMPVTLSSNDYGLTNSERRLFAACVQWLAGEKFLKFSQQTSSIQFVGCVLTAKGFHALSQSVSVGEEILSLGDVAEVAKSGELEAGSVGEFFGGVFAGAFKGLMS